MKLQLILFILLLLTACSEKSKDIKSVFSQDFLDNWGKDTRNLMKNCCVEEASSKELFHLYNHLVFHRKALFNKLLNSDIAKEIILDSIYIKEYYDSGSEAQVYSMQLSNQNSTIIAELNYKGELALPYWNEKQFDWFKEGTDCCPVTFQEYLLRNQEFIRLSTLFVFSGTQSKPKVFFNLHFHP